jgi:hypothetical protein
VRFWIGRVLVLGAAVGLGLLLQQLLGARLDAIAGRAQTDVIAARRELAQLLRVGAVLVFGMTGATGVAMLVASLRALRIGQFPPPGMLSWGGAARSVTGPRARVLAWIGCGLAALLCVCSLAGGAIVWEMAAALLACRAR